MNSLQFKSESVLKWNDHYPPDDTTQLLQEDGLAGCLHFSFPARHKWAMYNETPMCYHSTEFIRQEHRVAEFQPTFAAMSVSTTASAGAVRTANIAFHTCTKAPFKQPNTKSVHPQPP